MMHHIRCSTESSRRQQQDEVDSRCQAEEANYEEQTRVLDQFSWEQWVRGEELLVNDEDDQESETDCHASNNMSRIPCVWLLAPVESDKEQSDTRDGQESADKVDTTEDLALG